MRYRIAYKSTKTSYSGFGTWFDDRKLIQSMVDDMNKEFPTIKHWVEEEKPSETK